LIVLLILVVYGDWVLIVLVMMYEVSV